MNQELRRFHVSRQSHFLTFSCYQRQANFQSPDVYELFLECLEDTRRRFFVCVYGYVVMPEHVHLLVSEPGRAQVSAQTAGANLGHQITPNSPTLADAMHYLKLSFAKRLRSRSGKQELGSFWQKRYYDRNVRDEQEFQVKLRYLHRNPVKRGLVSNPADWRWSSFRHYAFREAGVVGVESEWVVRDREGAVRPETPRKFLCPT